MLLHRLSLIGAIVLLGAAMVRAAPALRPTFARVVFGSPSIDLADFEQFATRAKQSGATHINITAEDLPWATWQYDTPGDPYPTWVISNVGLLKIAPPAALQSHVSAEHAEKVMDILEARCRVLRRLGLKAAFHTFEAQMLPDAVFQAHPEWRGPRVDHPLRSRVERFAPSLDHPEVLALYQEAMATLVWRCPEIELLSLRTNDSGAGIDWSRGLYAGESGAGQHRERPMHKRLTDFFSALQQGAQAAGGSLEVEIYNTKEPNRTALAQNLPSGMGVDNLEGPAATPFKASVGSLLVYLNFYHPVTGIPQVESFVEALEHLSGSMAPRLFVALPDRLNRDSYFRAYDAFWQNPSADDVARRRLLKELAIAEVGPRHADSLVTVWQNLRAAERLGNLMSSGFAIVYGGGVLTRWITRPLVPHPSALPPEEKDYFRKYLLQARTEAHAENLTDIQATDIYAGSGGHFFVTRIVGEADALLAAAQSAAQVMADARSVALARRIAVFRCLLITARNAVSYQAQLERARVPASSGRPPANARPSWDRQMMLDTVSSEITNTTALIDLIKASPRDHLELAATPQEEDIRVLSPELVDQLQKKIRIMRAHLSEHDQLFSDRATGGQRPN